MDIIADMHCHTIASTHAYSTILENINFAAKKGLYAIAITDHARTMPGAPGPFYFGNLRIVPKRINGVYVFKGIEANIIDYEGNLDVDEILFDTLNWVVASMHGPTLEASKDKDACTRAYLNVAKNEHVNVIGHSGSKNYLYDYEYVIPEFKKNGKLIEINNASFNIRKESISNCMEIAKICKKCGASVIVNSDSHFCTQIGNVNHALDMLKEVDFPEELIVNSSVDRFKNYLKEYTNFFDD